MGVHKVKTTAPFGRGSASASIETQRCEMQKRASRAATDRERLFAGVII